MAGHDPAHSGTVAGPEAPYAVAWEADVVPVTGVAADQDVVVALTKEGIAALDPADGAVVWEEGRTAGPAGVPAIGGGLVVYSSSAGSTSQLVARDLKDGNEAWVTVVGTATSAPTISGKTVVVGTRGGEVVALELDTGVVKWRFETTGAVLGAPAVSDGLAIAAAYQSSSGTATFYGIDLETGETDDTGWRYTPGVVGQPSGIAVSDELAFVGTGDLNVRAIREGNEAWSVRAEDGFGAKQIPAATDSLILADRTNVYRLDPKTGEELWRFRLADLTRVAEDGFNTLLASSPAVSGTTVLLGSSNGTLSGIDIESGNRIWREDLGEGSVAPVAVANDRVYAATLGEEGAVFALEHDPEGALVDEVSDTVLDPAEALLNFALAAAAVGGVLLAISRVALLFRKEGDA
jgi:outer membrane protein assembly factor BamB